MRQNLIPFPHLIFTQMSILCIPNQIHISPNNYMYQGRYTERLFHFMYSQRCQERLSDQMYSQRYTERLFCYVYILGKIHGKIVRLHVLVKIKHARFTRFKRLFSRHKLSKSCTGTIIGYTVYYRLYQVPAISAKGLYRSF